MSPLSKKTFKHIFNSVETNTQFYLSANNEYSTEYELTVLSRPEIEQVAITVLPPKHTKMNSAQYLNTGSISVPQGSKLVWEIRTAHTDTLKFKIHTESLSLTSLKKKNTFKIEKTIKDNSKYEITLANSSVSFIDTLFYDIKTVSDAHPLITISKSAQNSKTIPIIDGLIRDDYGFLELNAFARIYGVKQRHYYKRAAGN